MNFRKVFLVLLIALTAVFAGNRAWASALSKPSPVGARAIAMGGAYVAVADDPMAIYWNPAGITQLKGTCMSIGFDSTIPGLSYHPYLPTDPTGASTTTERAQVEFLPAPSFGVTTDRVKPVVLGLGFYLPYANGGKFDNPSQSPYNPNDGRIYGLEIAPAVAFKVHELVSLGLTFRADYVKNKLHGQLLSPSFGAPFAGNYGDIDTDGWGFGGSAGVLIGPYKGWRFGITYRSLMKSKPTGTFTLKDASGNVLGESDASITLTFPNQLRVGVSYEVTPKLLLAAGFDWEQNSAIQSFDVTVNSSAGVVWRQTPADYDDSYTMHLGARYTFNKRWSGSFGYTYDEGSIPDATQNRIVGDVDAHEITWGVSYNRDWWGIDFAYDIRFGGRDVPAVDDQGNILPNQGAGDYFGYVQSVSLAGRFYFD